MKNRSRAESLPARPLTSRFFPLTICSVPEERIKSIEAVLTVLGGEVVYAAAPFETLAPPPLPAVLPAWSPVAHFGGYQKASRIQTGTMTARSQPSHATAWIDAIKALRYCFFIALHLHQHCRRKDSRERVVIICQ